MNLDHNVTHDTDPRICPGLGRLPVILSIVFCCLYGSPGWTDDSPAADRIKEATFTQKPQAVLPSGDSVPEWTVEGDIEIYMPQNLYEYNDGAAEVYLSYGFRKLATQRYVEKDNETNEVTVEVYDMDIPLQAFGIYAAERSVEDNFVELGGQGHVSETALGFWQSKFYIKMIFFGKKDDPKELLVNFARLISEQIEGPTGLPERFGVFPERDRIANTEQVFLSAPLGHSFLSPAFQVSYNSDNDEKPAMLLISVAPDEREAVRRLGQYHEHLKKIDSPFSAIEGYPDGCIQIQDRYLGECVVGRKGRFLVFLMGKAPNGPKIMAETWSNLEKCGEKSADNGERPK